METKQIEQIINEKKATAIKEAKKNRLVFRILSVVLLVLSVAMTGFGIDFIVHADKITGALVLTAGLVLLGSIITIKVFTERKMQTLLVNLEKIGTEDLAVDGAMEESPAVAVEDDVTAVEEAVEETVEEDSANE